MGIGLAYSGHRTKASVAEVEATKGSKVGPEFQEAGRMTAPVCSDGSIPGSQDTFAFL